MTQVTDAWSAWFWVLYVSARPRGHNRAHIVASVNEAGGSHLRALCGKQMSILQTTSPPPKFFRCHGCVDVADSMLPEVDRVALGLVRR